METVAANAVSLVQLIGQRVHVSDAWYRCMECRVEAGYLFGVRKSLGSGPNSHQIRWIVEWGQIGKPLDRSDHRIVNRNGPRELLAAVHDAMPDRPDRFRRRLFVGSGGM